MSKKLILSLLVLALFCSATIAETRTYILVAAGKPRLKDPVISKVIKDLKNEGYKIDTTTKTSLRGVRTRKYSAIILVNSVSDEKSNTGIRVFLDESQQKKVVLLNAIGDRYWISPDTATLLSDINRISSSVEEKTKALLGK